MLQLDYVKKNHLELIINKYIKLIQLIPAYGW